MPVRIQPTRKLSLEHKLERARAAAERARIRIAQATGDEAEIDFAHAPLSWWRKRWANPDIRRLFIENFIYVRDQFEENKLTLLKKNDLQIDLRAKINASGSRKHATVKFRRGGLSTDSIAEMFANCVVLSGRLFHLACHDPDVEADFAKTIKIMNENLPAHLKPALGPAGDAILHFHDPLRGTVDSWITSQTVQPGHEIKGRGRAITDLLCTEAPHWRGDQKKALTSLLEAAARANIVLESTPFGIEEFYRHYQKGKKREGGWVSHFYEWWWKRDYRVEGAQFKKARGKWVLLMPGQSLRDVWKILPATATEEQRAFNRASFDRALITEIEIERGRKIFDHLRQLGYLKHRATKRKADRWNCDEVAEYIAWRRAKIEELPGGERQFAVEYPENDQDCFEQSGRPVISAQYLKDPCAHQEPKANRSYVIAADSSLGVSGGNPGAIVILDLETGAMAHSEKSLMSPDRLAYRCGELSERYNGALIAPERNNTGHAVIQRLCDLGYTDRLYRHLDEALKRKVDEEKLGIDEAWELAKFGFPTQFQGAASKSHAALMLEESIRKQEIFVDQAFIDEAHTVVWFDNETFGPLPGQDHHADLFMATLIANYVRRTMAAMSGGFIGVMPEVGYAR